MKNRTDLSEDVLKASEYSRQCELSATIQLVKLRDEIAYFERYVQIIDDARKATGIYGPIPKDEHDNHELVRKTRECLGKFEEEHGDLDVYLAKLQKTGGK